MTSTAIADLTAAFDEAVARVGDAADCDRIVVTAWPSVPIEIVRAAGLRAVMARGTAASTPVADAHLEPGIFPSRLRHLVEAVLTERLSHAARIVIPRTSDADYKCFLYLREFERRGAGRVLAPAVLFDLLQSSGAHVHAYNAARTRALVGELAMVTGHMPSDDDLRREITQVNAARAAARTLVAMRRTVPCVTGTEVFPLLGAFWQMAPDRYAALANEAASAIAARPPLSGPRVLVAGAPVDTPALHKAIESHGAIVVGEVGPWGSGVAGDDVTPDEDPVAALAAKYKADSIGARTPVDVLRRRIERMLEDVEAVVVSLPPEDALFGWDYPALRDLLEARRLPHVCLRSDPNSSLTTAEHSRLDTLVGSAARHEFHHG